MRNEHVRAKHLGHTVRRLGVVCLCALAVVHLFGLADTFARRPVIGIGSVGAIAFAVVSALLIVGVDRRGWITAMCASFASITVLWFDRKSHHGLGNRYEVTIFATSVLVLVLSLSSLIGIAPRVRDHRNTSLDVSNASHEVSEA